MTITRHKRSYILKGGNQLELGSKTLIMGILNATPDSFSDGGKYNQVDAALMHTEAMLKAGADIIDIGGESTRPSFAPVEVGEEIKRVVPIIEAIRARFPEAVMSIDTYKSKTARYALEAGAHIINDVWGLKADAEMAAVAAEFDCPIIISHNRHAQPYEQVVADVISDLRSSIETARQAGVSDQQIWLDPGIGFAKDYEENLMVHAHLDAIQELGFPVLLGTSRKTFIRHTLDLPVDEVLEGTIASNVIGIALGCQIVRVHDVLAMKKAAKMADAIYYRRRSKL